MEYELETGSLREVVGGVLGNCRGHRAWLEGDASLRQRRPVYSEDGRQIYYVNIDQNVMRHDLDARRSEQLPLGNAFAVLTVRGEEIIYAGEATRGKEGFQIIKAGLGPAGGRPREVLHETRGELHWNLVSPCRRFILFLARSGYNTEVCLLDLDGGAVCSGRKLLGPEVFKPHGTVFCPDPNP
jgi:hypothetical protein